MEKKQTSVQWLLQQIENNLAIGYNNITKQQHEQALQMEREQIEEAFQDGWMQGHYKSIDKAEYYTQTFKP
jgi:hypothetical protein